MQHFYSPSTGGFYNKEVHGDNLPADAVEITEEEYQHLLAGQARNLVIVPQGSGAKPTLAPPPAPTLGEAKAQKLKEINRKAQAALDAVLAAYPDGEVASWPKQEEEARKWLADNSTPTPMLSAIAARRGLTLEDLASRVIAKADAFATFGGGILGKRQALEDALDRTTTAEEALALPVTF